MQHFYSFVSQVAAGVRPFPLGHVAFLFICLPGLSLLVSALFRWRCNISIHLSPGLSLVVSALFRWPCSISIHLSPRSVTAGVVSALFRWPCSISIHLSPRSVTAGVRPFPPCSISTFVPGLSLVVSALFRWRRNISIHSPISATFRGSQHFYSFPNQCPFRGSQFFLKLLVSALFRWPCSVSIHLYQKWFLYFCLPSSVCPASVHPNPLAMQRFYSFASQMICLLFFSRFGACAAGLRPFPLSSISIHLSPRWFLYFPKQVIYC